MPTLPLNEFMVWTQVGYYLIIMADMLKKKFLLVASILFFLLIELPFLATRTHIICIWGLHFLTSVWACNLNSVQKDMS